LVFFFVPPPLDDARCAMAENPFVGAWWG